MDFTKDPNDRRRVDAEIQRNRDAEVARLRAAHVPFREIGRRLGMSLGAVQKAVRRHQKRSGAAKQQQHQLDELDAVLAPDDWLDAYEVADRPEVWYRCNPLACRLLHGDGQRFGSVPSYLTGISKCPRRRLTARYASPIT